MIPNRIVENWTCGFCGTECTGHGNNPWPMAPYNEFLVCDKCNGMVLASRFLRYSTNFIDENKECFDRECYNKLKESVKTSDSDDMKSFYQFFSRWFENSNIDKITVKAAREMWHKKKLMR